MRTIAEALWELEPDRSWRQTTSAWPDVSMFLAFLRAESLKLVERKTESSIVSWRLTDLGVERRTGK